MVTCICIIKANKKIIGYRLFDLETLEYKDVSAKSVLQNIDKIDNIVRGISGEACIIGMQDGLYPVYDRLTGEVYNGDKLVYVGRTADELCDDNSKQEYISNKSKALHRIDIYNNVCEWNGMVYSIKANDLQRGILDKSCLNVAEGYTGRLGVRPLISNKVLRDYNNENICNICFCSIREIYYWHGIFKKADIIEYFHRVYDVKRHKLTTKAKSNNKNIVEVYHCGILNNYMDIEFPFRYEDDKLPLYIDDNIVYYVNGGMKVVKDDIYGYIGCGLDGVFKETSLLESSRESSFCILSANKIYILAMNSLKDLDREGCMGTIRQAMKERGNLLYKLQLTGNKNIEADNKGRVLSYHLCDKVNRINITKNIKEFDLCNIDVGVQTYEKLHAHIIIPDEHGLIYMSHTASHMVYFDLLECNDIALGKKLLKNLTYGFQRDIIWRVSGEKITAGLIKWAYSKDGIIIEPRGGIYPRVMNKAVEFVLGKDGIDIKKVTNDIKEFNSIKNELSLFNITPIFINEHMDTEVMKVQYNEVNRLTDRMFTGKLQIGNIAEYGDIYYGKNLTIQGEIKGTGEIVEATAISYAGNKGVAITDIGNDIGMTIDIRLDNIRRAVKLIRGVYERIENFKQLDERINKVYTWLFNLYNTEYKGLIEEGQITTPTGMSSLQFGYFYKRDKIRECRVIGVKRNNSFEFLVYLKYVKYRMTEHEINTARKRVIITGRCHQSRKECSGEMRQYIENSLPEVLWVCLDRVFRQPNECSSEGQLDCMLKEMGMQVNSNIVIYDLDGDMEKEYPDKCLYEGSSRYAGIFPYMAELKQV